MIIAAFKGGELSTRTPPLWQYDRGQEMEIRGLELPAGMIEVHFANQQTAEAIIKTGTTIAGVTTVGIPDELLMQPYPIMAYVYVVTPHSGRTMYTIYTHVQPRARLGQSGDTPGLLPAGGATGQYLVKASDADFDAIWDDGGAGTVDDITTSEIDALFEGGKGAKT